MLRLLPLLAGVLPLLAAWLSLWIGVNAGSLPSCLPILDGCLSISATGRRPPGSFLFRAIMLPQSVLLLFTWYFSVAWLRSLDNNLRGAVAGGILASGIISALALATYITFLGTSEPLYEFMRRVGIYFSFLGMVIAELLVAGSLLRMTVVRRHARMTKLAQWMLGLCLSPFVLGILNLYLKATLDDADSAENVIEWIATTLMQSYLVVMYFAWRVSGFELLPKNDLN